MWPCGFWRLNYYLPGMCCSEWVYATLTAILSGFLFVYLDFFCVVCHLIFESGLWTLCTVQLRMHQKVQIFIFARFVHVLSCSRFAGCFIHHSERSTKPQGSATKRFVWATKGFWFNVSWGSWPWPSVDFMYVFLCFIFLSRCYCSDVLLFIDWVKTYTFILGQKNPNKLIYLCRTDTVPILLRWDYFVLLAESLPVFLEAYNALEVLGHAWSLIMNGITGSSACS